MFKKNKKDAYCSKQEEQIIKIKKLSQKISENVTSQSSFIKVKEDYDGSYKIRIKYEEDFHYGTNLDFSPDILKEACEKQLEYLKQEKIELDKEWELYVK